MADQVKLTRLQLLHEQQYRLHKVILSLHIVHASCRAVLMGAGSLSRRLATALRSAHGRLRVVPLLLVLLTHDTLVVPCGSRPAHLDGAVLLILTLATISCSATRLLKNIWGRRSLQLTIAHVLGLARTSVRLLGGLHIRWRLLKYFVEI